MQSQIPPDVQAEIDRQRKELDATVYGGGLKITLDTGRVITMERLNQVRTYLGQMEGYPKGDTKVGKIIDDAVDSERLENRWRDDDHSYIIYAPVTKWDFLEIQSKYVNVPSHHLERMPETLPRIQCTARFESDSIKRLGIEENDMSYIDLVWYQHEWAMPIAPEVMGYLKAFDWENIARLGWI